MKILRNFLENLACIPLYLFARLVPKDPKLWIFGAWFGYRYSDNSRYVFEHVQTHEVDIRAIWLSREKKIVSRLRTKGYEAYRLRSLKGFWFSCRAAIVFLSSSQFDVNLVGSRHALKVQLWHGIPLKKIKADDAKTKYNRGGPVFHLFRSIWMTIFPFDKEDWDLFVTSGPEMTRRIASAFNGFMAKDGRIVELGNPRADRILSPPDLNVMRPFIKPFPVERIVCYAPTFRGTSSTLNLFYGLDSNALGRLLSEWKVLLLVNLHYYDRNQIVTERFSERVHFVTDEELEDINTLLPHVDVLITDYSSIFYDYLLLDRPILFSPFDMESYLADERGLYEPYRKAVPGEICMNWSELIDQLNHVFQGKDDFQQKRCSQLKRFFNYLDQNNAVRITDYLKKLSNYSAEI